MSMYRETGKDRWSRVPKDYFKKSDRIQRVKFQVTILAVVLSLAWFAIGVDWSGEGSSTTDLNSLRANHGVLARVHATWDTKCEACHKPFEAIDGRPLFSSKPAAERSSDKLCMSCHQGPDHHAAVISSEVKSCAECHRDHQGRDFSMVRLNDNDCTSCHAKLETDYVVTARKPVKERKYENVTAFHVDHPTFSPEAAELVDGKLQDRSKLKFNHGLHMTKGILPDASYLVEKIPVAAERPRYQKSGTLKDPVQLECASCHVLDATEIQAAPNPAVASTTLPGRNPGRYYLPINYQTQCRACHNLTFDPRLDQHEVEVPHGVQPDQVIAFLKRVNTERAVGDDPSLLSRKVRISPLPGKRPSEATAEKLLDDSVNKVVRTFFETKNSCQECHWIENDAKGNPIKVEPTKVPEIWFTHAKFDHTPHRGVSCRECHSRAYPLEAVGLTLNKEVSIVSTDVLIPTKENCVQCHAPARSSGGWFGGPGSSSSTGGASFNCTECHRYHNGDNLAQGIGASAWDADRERSVVEFLTGKGGRPTGGLKPEK